MRNKGFTIVELLIVIVVIAILAAVTIVAYNGIQNRAKASAAQSAASQASKKAMAYAVLNADQYPADIATLGVADSGDTTFQYSVNNTANPKTFCVTATTSTASYYVSNTQPTPVVGGCPGHGVGGVAAITNLARNPHAISGGSGWTNQTPAGSTLTYVANGANDGGSAYQMVTTAANPMRIGIPQSVGSVVIGDVLTISMDVFSPISTTAQMEAGINGTFPKSAVFNIVPGWNRLTGAVTAGVAGPVTLTQLVTVGNASAGQTWLASRGIIIKGTHNGDYFDGYSTNWIWNGAATTSTSTGPAP